MAWWPAAGLWAFCLGCYSPYFATERDNKPIVSHWIVFHPADQVNVIRIVSNSVGRSFSSKFILSQKKSLEMTVVKERCSQETTNRESLFFGTRLRLFPVRERQGADNVGRSELGQQTVDKRPRIPARNGSIAGPQAVHSPIDSPNRLTCPGVAAWKILFDSYHSELIDRTSISLLNFPRPSSPFHPQADTQFTQFNKYSNFTVPEQSLNDRFHLIFIKIKFIKIY